MSRYIDADELLKEAYKDGAYGYMRIYVSAEQIANFPTADVVKRGRWLRTDAYPHRIYCSNCYGTYALDHWGIWIDGSLPRAYCPNCGAKMVDVDEVKE